jgi:hypothetical protein
VLFKGRPDDCGGVRQVCHHGRVTEVKCPRCQSFSRHDSTAKRWDCRCGSTWVHGTLLVSNYASSQVEAVDVASIPTG